MKKYFRIIYIAACLFILLGAAACSQNTASRYTKPAATDETAPGNRMTRADPGYVQYLERQSMLAGTIDLARIVSGCDIAWRNSGSQPNPQRFMEIGSTWLRIHPQTVLVPARRSPFEQLANPIMWTVMGNSGMTGMYVAPTGASGAIWDYARSAGLNSAEDIINYNFAMGLGKDEDFRAILKAANQRQAMLGGDIVPAATGIGPDFFLAARSLRDYPGIYCMMEVPRELWPTLPQASEEWSAQKLSSAQVAALAEKKLIPPSMAQDKITFLPQNGWAITGEVRGMDGTLRRWVYRYSGNPQRPVLNWEDPSAAARRIISGSSIRQVGILGNALVGYRVAPWMGLDTRGTHSSPDETWQPAEEAAVTIAREVRRYGGWGWIRDDVPIPFLQLVMRDGPDFAQDSIFSPAAEHALLTGNASLLNFMTDEALRCKFDLKRLVHATSGPDGVNYALPHLQWLASMSNSEPEHKARAGEILAATLEEMRAATAGSDLETGNVLYSTPAGLAALAMKVPDPTAVGREEGLTVKKGHLLLMFYKAMQPGVFMPSGQDAVGALPVNWTKSADKKENWNASLSAMGAFPLLASADSITVNAQGLPRANTLYAPLDVQTHDNTSFLHDVNEFISVRRSLLIDRSELAGRIPAKGKGVIATVYKLPKESHFAISICNFSQVPSTETLDCGSIPGLIDAMRRYTPVDITRHIGTVNNNGSAIQLTLPAWTGVLIYVGGAV